MLNPDEIIEYGFSGLRDVQPKTNPFELAVMARRRESRAKLKKTAFGSLAFVAATAALALFMQPTSALAALKESARITAAQPILHVRFDTQDSPHNSTSTPWPPVPTTEVWKFSDHYIRKHGHTIFIAFKDGRTFAYDNRFPEGFQSKYDSNKDRFWTFDGTISEELARAHTDLPVVHDATIRGTRYTDFEWQDIDGMQNKTSSHIYVDPETKLVRLSESNRTNPSGDTSHTWASVDYPSSQQAKKETPQFPRELKFRTADDLLKKYNKELPRPEQSKSLRGIRTTLYGVVIYPNVPDGLGVNVITQGGAGPDFGSGHQPEIVGSQLLPTKRSAWTPSISDAEHTRHGFFTTISEKSYIVNQSDELLIKAPSRITIRVPVWRASSTTVDRDGKPIHPHIFIGYVTFTTSKIFLDVADPDLNYYERQPNRR